MGKYRKVDPRIWNDKKFNKLSDRGKLAFFFILTHPHMTALGAMRASIPGLASEIGWTEKAFREAFKEALAKGMLKHDKKASFVWLPNFLKYNKPESPNVIKSWVASLDYLPECRLKSELIQQVKDFMKALPKAFGEALPEAFRKTMPNHEQEQEQEPEQDNIFSPNSDEFRHAKLLYDLILQNDPKAKEPNMQKWAYDIDKLHRLDRRSFEEIESAIRWCQKDDFWHTNILSAGKLRGKFQQLILKMKGNGDATNRSGKNAGFGNRKTAGERSTKYAGVGTVLSSAG
jgi:hypothetical protein